MKKCFTWVEEFYTLLQQASEKAIKAYLIAYFKPFIKALMLPKNARIDRSKQPQILIVYKLIKDTADLITIKNLGHEPGITVFKAMCNLYELIYRNKYALNDYIKFYSYNNFAVNTKE